MEQSSRARRARRWLHPAAWPRLAAVLPDLLVALVVVDEGLRVLECTAVAARLLGRTRGDVLGRSVSEVLPGCEPPPPTAPPGRTPRLSGDGSLSVGWTWSSRGGRRTAVGVLDDADVESRTALLTHAAAHDPLTGLMNRACLQEHLTALVGPGARAATAVLFVDLDRFKLVNDRFGHEAGDQLLVAVAQRLRSAVRPGDVVARFGGDEFVVVSADVTTVTVATAVAQRVLAALADPVQVGSASLSIGVSIGIALSAGQDVSIAVNVSAGQLTSPGFVGLVQSELEEAGAEARRLVLELTENVLVADSDRQLDTMVRLRELGVRLALDDFGTGNASLTCLRRFPVDLVKLYRSFVSQIATQPQDRIMVEAVVSLARALGVEVVAEGVEQPEDAALLAALGCHRAQGWLFGRSVSAAELHAAFDVPVQRRADDAASRPPVA